MLRIDDVKLPRNVVCQQRTTFEKMSGLTFSFSRVTDCLKRISTRYGKYIKNTFYRVKPDLLYFTKHDYMNVIVNSIFWCL